MDIIIFFLIRKLFTEKILNFSIDFSRTNEDLTVDYFLKTLAGQNLQDLGQSSGNTVSPDKPFGEKDLAIFR